jgi:hypothetical protein
MEDAIQRDDPDLEAWTSAVALRAHYRIGEICRGLEKATNQHALSTGGKSKAETLKSAAIFARVKSHSPPSARARSR